MRNLNDETAGAGSDVSYIRGDRDPKDFDYKTAMTREELLNLSLRNPKIQKATAWFANEVLRERWEFEKDESISGMKFGEAFTFPTFNDWLEWNGFMQEVQKAITWSLLFGDAIIVFYDGKESTSGKKGNDFHLKKGENYIMCKAFYEMTKGNGYRIEEVDPFFGTAKQYKITLHAYRAKESVSYIVDDDRVVRFSAPQKELKYEGTSAVTTIAKDCLVQEQIKRSVMSQANMLQGGILAVKASTEEEKDLVDVEIGDSFSYLRRVYCKNSEEMDNLFKLIVPDLKIEQLEKMNDILQRDISTGMDMSKSNLEGAPQGALSSAEYDTLNTYSRVKQLQAHFTRSMERCFKMFGKDNTQFEWFDPSPQEAIMNERTTNFNVSQGGGGDDDKIKEDSDGDDVSKRSGKTKQDDK